MCAAEGKRERRVRWDGGVLTKRRTGEVCGVEELGFNLCLKRKEDGVRRRRLWRERGGVWLIVVRKEGDRTGEGDEREPWF